MKEFLIFPFWKFMQHPRLNDIKLKDVAIFSINQSVPYFIITLYHAYIYHCYIYTLRFHYSYSQRARKQQREGEITRGIGRIY